MNEAENVRGFATAFYETMEAFDLPKYLMTHRDQLDVDGRHEEGRNRSNLEWTYSNFR